MVFFIFCIQSALHTKAFRFPLIIPYFYKMNYLLYIFLFLFSFGSYAQEKKAETGQLNLYQDSLSFLCRKIYNSKTDTDKHKYNQEFLSTFERALNSANSFEFAFDSLKKDIAILKSPDEKFRVINWNIPKSDGTQEYYGFIQEKYTQIRAKGFFRKEHIETMQLYPLIDKSDEIKKPENTISDNKKWYGMGYYKIIQKKTKSKTYYTLLAWDGNDKYTSKKIIDVLTFDNNGTPRFGADIFVMQKKYPKRIIFEYSSTCSMSLKYSEKKDSIVFDHLAPTEPRLEGQFQYYCGDMSYDGFGFKHGKWNYGMDLNAINEKDYKDKIYNDPHNNGKTSESNLIIQPKKKKKKK